MSIKWAAIAQLLTLVTWIIMIVILKKEFCNVDNNTQNLILAVVILLPMMSAIASGVISLIGGAGSQQLFGFLTANVFALIIDSMLIGLIYNAQDQMANAQLIQAALGMIILAVVLTLIGGFVDYRAIPVQQAAPAAFEFY